MTNPDSQDSPDRQAEGQPTDMRGSAADLLNALYKTTSEEAARYDLTVTQFNLLRACLEGGEECTATELAQVLPMDTSRISRIVTILVDRGLLQRRRQTDDRRIVMLTLSEEGRELTSRVIRNLNLYDSMLTEGIDDNEMRVFVSVASRVVSNYTAMQGDE